MAEDLEVWKQVFQELIQEVKPWHRWTLTLDRGLLPNTLQPGWSQYQQWAFARFQCSLCSRSWASSQVQVLFHMHKSKEKPRGKVKMRVFAQRCRKCYQSPFEVPEFTKENISRILNNLVFRILKKCYREGFKSMEEIPTIKEISLEGPHDSNNCEACLQGFCAQSGVGPATQAPVSLALAPISPSTFRPTIPMPTAGGIRVDTVNTEANRGRDLPREGSTEADRGRDLPREGSTKANRGRDLPREGSTEANRGRDLPRPWYSGSTQPSSLPTHWSPRTNTYHHVERQVQVTPWNERLYSHIAPNPRHRYWNVCCCCIILVIVVVIIVEIIQWIST
ncbi:receptor-transporting protein 3 [Hyaena hyaena]|uniref:receptor-transporting protein 3 n=1 Tax=Hyaena hyaena TaxID=95912 RepID=UPI0019223D33|nr:receptor-transporting protein 3 [Hyaena hyaena]XP_039084167.1 receptor-transporting protein 3 [Hyaena hyaena]XP_039084168.1 receptor-transporting protein 3 [Hyaena hyaena]XP_039084169.1 receptor-transporting protein 3 [Hyaena hyaena]